MGQAHRWWQHWEQLHVMIVHEATSLWGRAVSHTQLGVWRVRVSLCVGACHVRMEVDATHDVRSRKQKKCWAIFMVMLWT